MNDGFGLEPGVWFRLCLGGLTGHKSFAGDTGVLVKPADATLVADAVVRVFIDHGDRTDRTKARLKYVLDKMGVEKFLGLMEEKLGRKLDRAVPGALAPRPPFSRTAHLGIHAQKQDGLQLDRRRRAGRPADGRADEGPCRDRARAGRRRYQAHGLAKPADFRRAHGQAGRGASEDRRRSAWRSRPMRSAPGWSPAPAIPAANSPPPTPSGTPRRSRAGARRACALDTPVNIHLTGCHHSCAQHFVSEIGLLACKVQETEDGDPIEGYHLLIGGGFGPYAALGRELYRDVKADDAPKTVERVLKTYLAHRASREESFIAFARRHEIDALKAMVELEAAE